MTIYGCIIGFPSVKSGKSTYRSYTFHALHVGEYTPKRRGGPDPPVVILIPSSQVCVVEKLATEQKMGFVPNKCQIRVDGCNSPKKRKAKGVPF